MASTRRLLIPYVLNVLAVVFLTTISLFANEWVIVTYAILHAIGILVNTHTAFVIGRTTVHEENIARWRGLE